MTGYKNRFLAMAAAAVLTLSFAGCSKTDDSSQNDDNSSSVTSEDNESSQEEALNEFQTITDGTARVKVENTKFTVDGKELWINGVNSAWNKWNDFGGSFNFEFWDDHFQALHDAGCNASRIWVLCNGDVGLELNDDGTVKGATDKHWKDLDDLFFLAEKYQIYLMPTIMSFDFCKSEGQENITFKQWRELLTDDKKVDSFVDNYVAKFAERYGKSDYLWSIDLCNEPDWIIEQYSGQKIKWEHLQKLFAKEAAVIHEKSDTLVTVGMAMIKYNSDEVEGNVISDKALQETLGDDTKYDKSKAYVDFYSTHWYSWMIPNWGTNYEQTPKAFKHDTSKPCMIAEIPAIDTHGKAENYDITDVYSKAYKNGWQGVMAWKASGGDDGCGTWLECEPAIKKIYETCPEKVYPIGKKES